VLAVNSVFEQSVPPDEVVVVGDGPLSAKLNSAIKDLKKKHENLHYYELPTNQGVGAASNFGIDKCRNALIAKMDADDISTPDRLEKQIAEFVKDQDLVLLGGQIEEFANNDPENIVSRREVPTKPEDIIKFARRRSPMNNPTVMFRKETIQAVGGYPGLNRAEDYGLFVRLISAKKKLRNLPDVIVKYRLGADNTQRRKSWQHTKEMIKSRHDAYKLGVARWSDFVYMTIAFIALFIMPSRLAEIIYQRRLRK